MKTCFAILSRRKVLDAVQIRETRLARVLSFLDLSSLGIGSTLGLGVYVLAGNLARNVAGPSVVLSFLLAGIASVFAGLCYAEFGSRVPRAGSAYVYSYTCVGEFSAFVIGWNLILEYVIGSAAGARGLSLYLDTLLNGTLQNTFEEIAPIGISFMSPYFDFFAFGVSMLFAAGLAFGMKESTTLNNICTFINLAVVSFIITVGSFRAKIANWNLEPPANSTNYGVGGFFPYGISGTLQGAATCFYGFVGFDAISATGEEVENPQRTIPLAILATLAVVLFAYLGTSTVLTLMVPYYLQNVDAPIPYAFSSTGWAWAEWIVEVGAVFGICTSLFGTIFPLPRVIYGMASDGIIFKFLGRVSDRFHTPLIGTLLGGLMIGLMAALFELTELVNMLSIATLLAYTIVSASVLLLRYSVDEVDLQTCSFGMESTEKTPLVTPKMKLSLKLLFNLRQNLVRPTKNTQNLVAAEVFVFALLSLTLGLFLFYAYEAVENFKIWALAGLCIILLSMILTLLSITSQPSSKKPISFKVPFVPLVPALSILLNISLMVMLDNQTWIRFAIWMVLGLLVYGCYGYPNSKRDYQRYETLK